MPMSAHEVRQALHELGDLRYAAGNLDEALRRIVHATHQLFAVDGAGLMLIDPDQLLRNVADSDRRVDHLEELQIEHGEGPCIDAYEEKDLVHAADLAAETRWPRFCPAAVDRGLLAVLASPIPYSDQAVGVVTVFAFGQHEWTEAEREAIVAFTELVALLILNAMEARDRSRLAGELQVALDSRVAIEQAKGVLVGRHGLTTRQAFERLRRQARDQRRPLPEVARDVVSAAERQ
jgi:GAF domain-containing protein